MILAFSQLFLPYVCPLLFLLGEIWDRFQSLSGFCLVTSTLPGWMPTWTVVPLASSRCSQRRWQTSSHKLGPCCQSAALCRALAKSELSHPFRQARIEDCSSVSALLERGEDIIFLWTWGSALMWLFWFLLWWEATKELNFILAAGASAVVTVSATFFFFFFFSATFLKEERCFLTVRLSVINHVKNRTSRSEDFGTGPCAARAPVVHWGAQSSGSVVLALFQPLLTFSARHPCVGHTRSPALGGPLACWKLISDGRIWSPIFSICVKYIPWHFQSWKSQRFTSHGD